MTKRTVQVAKIDGKPHLFEDVLLRAMNHGYVPRVVNDCLAYLRSVGVDAVMETVELDEDEEHPANAE